jgi:6-phosphofructokinase 1
LKTARSAEFLEKEGRSKAYRNLRNDSIDALIVIGGDGSFEGALIFHREYSFPVIGIPGTIDNDIHGTQRTLGFDTALNTGMDAIDKIKDTASSMDRIFIIEVMGRLSGAIAVYSALAGGAEDVIVPGETREMKDIIRNIESGRKMGKKSWIIISAEGAGWTQKLADKLSEAVGEVRVTVIGHIQRGGSPSAFDRFLGAMMGQAALDGLLEGKALHAVGWVNDETILYPLEEATAACKQDFSKLLELIQVLT